MKWHVITGKVSYVFAREIKSNVIMNLKDIKILGTNLHTY